MELIDCNIYWYNNSIEQELEPTEVDDLSGVSWPHSENEEIHQDLLQDVIKINWIDNSTNNTGTTERNYTTDLIRGEDIEISIEGHNCIAHFDNGSGMTIMTLKTFGELKGKFAKPMTYFKFDKPFSFQSSSDHAIRCVGYCKLLTKNHWMWVWHSLPHSRWNQFRDNDRPWLYDEILYENWLCQTHHFSYTFSFSIYNII